jgi:general stress protein 26
MKGYGIPAVRKGMLDWKRVSQQLRQSRNYWIATTTPDGLPHAVPVWGVWVDGALYFGTDRRSRKARNLATNQGAVVHLESGDDAVILEGFAEEITGSSVVDRIDQSYFEKYKMRLTQAPGELVIYGVRPRVAFAWRERDFPRSATRWRFSSKSSSAALTPQHENEESPEPRTPSPGALRLDSLTLARRGRRRYYRATVWIF